ncbi:MAG TPA: hypothetical protein VGH99_07570 [Pseudonocardia sp.]
MRDEHAGAERLAGRVRAAAAGVARRWIDAMAGAAERAGQSPERAAERAREAFARIEGGLGYSRLAGDTSVFERALAELPATLGAELRPPGSPA